MRTDRGSGLLGGGVEGDPHTPVPRCILGYTHGQTDACENITFASQSVITKTIELQ